MVVCRLFTTDAFRLAFNKAGVNVLLLRQPARVFIYVHGQIYVAGGKNAALKEDAENPF